MADKKKRIKVKKHRIIGTKARLVLECGHTVTRHAPRQFLKGSGLSERHAPAFVRRCEECDRGR